MEKLLPGLSLPIVTTASESQLAGSKTTNVLGPDTSSEVNFTRPGVVSETLTSRLSGAISTCPESNVKSTASGSPHVSP